MEKRRQVAMYESSLYMAGIATSLRADSTLEVLCVSPESPTVRASLDDNDLAVIVFDLSDPSLKLEVALLRDRPGLLLIGVDPSKDELLVLSSRTEQALSMADLLKVIHQKETASRTLDWESHISNQRK